jgi:hypothetical protein
MTAIKNSSVAFGKYFGDVPAGVRTCLPETDGIAARFSFFFDAFAATTDQT